jgi:Arc/MetJ-type ribon-helix-helix transcriptional regulator
MSSVSVELPESLKRSIEQLAAQEGSTLSEFVAAAAGEKLAAIQATASLRREAAAGRREDFERYMAAVPDVPPADSDCRP